MTLPPRDAHSACTWLNLLHIYLPVSYTTKKVRAENRSPFILLCVPSTWSNEEALNKFIEWIRWKHNFLMIFFKLHLFVTNAELIPCLKNRPSQTLSSTFFFQSLSAVYHWSPDQLMRLLLHPSSTAGHTCGMIEF